MAIVRLGVARMDSWHNLDGDGGKAMGSAPARIDAQLSHAAMALTRGEGCEEDKKLASEFARSLRATSTIVVQEVELGGASAVMPDEVLFQMLLPRLGIADLVAWVKLSPQVLIRHFLPA